MNTDIARHFQLENITYLQSVHAVKGEVDEVGLSIAAPVFVIVPVST